MLTGFLPAVHTPFQSDGSLNLTVIEQQANHMHKHGAIGAFVCGTTGECMSLTTTERMQVAERWLQVANGRFQVIVHVGHASLRDSQHLAEHAAKLGAAGVAMVAPFYHTAANVVDLVESLAVVAASAGELPFYFYDIPSVTHVQVATPLLFALCIQGIPSFAGLKFSNKDLVVLQECVSHQQQRHSIFFGVDEMLLTALSIGVRAAVGSTYNFALPMYQRLLAAFQSGDLALAQRYQLESVKMVRMLENSGGLSANKEIMRFLGIDCGPVRLPLRSLSKEQRTTLQMHWKILKEVHH